MAIGREDYVQAPSFFKLGACLIYEALVVIAILMGGTCVFILLLGDSSQGLKRFLLQLFLLIIVGLYFVWFWHKSGRTLAMQTWRLQLLGQNGQLLSVQVAFVRYLLACISLAAVGLGFAWALVDRDRLFFHDRVLNNRIIYVPRSRAL